MCDCKEKLKKLQTAKGLSKDEIERHKRRLGTFIYLLDKKEDHQLDFG